NKNIKNSRKFISGLLIPLMIIIVYFIRIGVLGDFWYWAVIFNLTTYAKSGVNPSYPLSSLIRILLVYGAALAILFKKDKSLVKVFVLFIVGTLFGAFDRADFVHFQPSLLFVLMATVFGSYE